MESMVEKITSQELAWQIRYNAVQMCNRTHASHIAAVMSVADIMSVLYTDTLTKFPEDPENDKRDRFILSKGHAGISVYVSLAYTGFFPVERLETYYMDGSTLSGHISHKNVPGVEFSTGSLGHGIGAACGMAMTAKIQGKGHHVYCVVGDGECEEGEVWETAQFAARQGLDNFTVIVDHNKWQAMGTLEEELAMTNMAERWKVAGFEVVEADGHDHEDMKAKFKTKGNGKPVVVICHTTKGKGVSFMENNLLWHYRDPQGEFYETAIKELEEARP